MEGSVDAFRIEARFLCLLVFLSSTILHSANAFRFEMDESSLESLLSSRLGSLMDRVSSEGLDLEIDGQQVFSGKDRFLPGKIALGLSYWLENGIGPEEKAQRMSKGKALLQTIKDQPNDSWGICFYLMALHRLKTAGLIEDTVPPDLLNELKGKLKWTDLWDANTHQIKGKATNYLGVAFMIARLRYLLGWDPEDFSQPILDRIMDHIRDTSGGTGFSDEVAGQGRYDRYSILLVAEIAHRLRETGLTPDEELLGWLRDAAKLVMANINADGHGFLFGRSIGAYGDSAFLEILSAAAVFGLLSEDEKAMAHSFSLRATERFLTFWWDDTTDAVNLWDRGRATDAYRGKHRILGESLSLLHHHLYTNRIWEDLDVLKDGIPGVLDKSLSSIPANTLTPLTGNGQSRAVFTRRNKGRVFSLWISSGGNNLHDKTSYYPIPFSPGIVEAPPDQSIPQLVPLIRLKDGTELMPLVFAEGIKMEESEDTAIICYTQPGLDVVGKREPTLDDRIGVEVTYRFEDGRIIRKDRFIPKESVNVESISILYAQGDLSARVFFSGYEEEYEHSDETWLAPDRVLRGVKHAFVKEFLMSKPVEVEWCIEY